MSEKRPTTDDEGTVEPEYDEEHPITPPTGQEDISVAELRPEVEGETIPERARQRGEASG